MSNSLPDLSTRQISKDAEYYEEEIKNLKEQLGIAHSEIGNINIENNNLKMKLIEQERTIKELKEICTNSPLTPKPKSTLKKRKRIQLNKTLLNNSSSYLCMKSDEEKDNCLDATETVPTSKVHKSTQESDSNIKISSNNTQHTHSKLKGKSENSVLKMQAVPKVYIAGGHQMSGLASRLIRSRVETKYEKYNISSVTKPNATSKEILKCCHGVEQSMDNFLILSVGEHDVNPNELMYELIATLKSLQNINIIIVNIIRNKSLNELMLNNMFKNICHNFENCNFLNIDSDINYKRIDLQIACHNINYMLDCKYYKNNFLSLQNLESRETKPQKGTIPYYFPVTPKPHNITNINKDKFFL